MSLDTAQTQSPPVTQVDQLVETFRSSERQGAGPLLLGLEHEKLLFPRGGTGPVAYQGPAGINAVLEGFRQFLGSPSTARRRACQSSR